MENNLESLVIKLLRLKVKNENRLNKAKRKFASQNKRGMSSNAELFDIYRQLVQKKKVKADTEFEKVLQKRKIRTLSGVAPIAVLTKLFPCQGECLFCPTQKGMPKSYLNNEPAVMRAQLSKFDPFKQVLVRLKALERNGHLTDKLELIIMGGTWSAFPKTYQKNFIKRCFEAANGTKSKTIEQAHRLNEKAQHRIVALTIETRPDCVDEKQISFWRELGATKIELGVQIADDTLLRRNLRQHATKEIIEATKLLKMAGFKICYHIMPGLVFSNPTKDLKAYKTLFQDERYQPDFVKIYPTVITKNTKLYRLWKNKAYRPYSDKALFQLLLKMKLATPQYVRIIRLIRDIPEQSIVAGNKVSNLRQDLQTALKKHRQKCVCIRCREAREDVKNLKQAKLSIIKYQASGAQEYFLQFTDKTKNKLYAFLRLRLPDKAEKNYLREISGCAIIREVHTFGRLTALNKTNKKSIQHMGFGRRLLAEAEKIASFAGFAKMAVISGVGVRNYYRALGYKKQGTYMIKTIKSQKSKN